MAYLDLYTLRANMSKTPEESDFTSVKKRITSAQKNTNQKRYILLSIIQERTCERLPFKLTDYLELIDMTGRIIREVKRGSIDASLLPILIRLNISTEKLAMYHNRI